MKLLILTQYYPPEVGAPQNRLSDLAKRLTALGVEVTVLTAMPNYPQMKIHSAYRGKCSCRENIDGIKVYRSWVYVSTRRSVFHRLLNYFSFVFSSVLTGIFRVGRQNYILVESPPLFLGISGYLLKVFKRSRLIFNVSDLWPESAEKLNIVRSGFFLGISYRLEAFLYRHSFIVSGQTMGICDNISARFPEVITYWLPNGVDPEGFDPALDGSNRRKMLGLDNDDFVVMYAGILGYAQGLSTMVSAAAMLQDEKSIRFLILGSGPEKEKLIAEASEKSPENIIFPSSVSKNEIPEMLAAADAVYVPLKKLDIFLGAIPSKIFEGLAMARPLILGVEGEARRLFIDEGKAGLFVEPENPAQLVSAVKKLLDNRELGRQLGRNGRKFVLEKFDRRIIAAQFFEFIKEKEDSLL